MRWLLMMLMALAFACAGPTSSPRDSSVAAIDPQDAAMILPAPDANQPIPSDASTVSGSDATTPFVPGLQYNGSMAFEREVTP